MNSPVRVSADEAGNIISQSSNPEYGYIRLVQTKHIIDDNGFLRNREVSALLQGSMEDLQGMKLKAGQEVPGKIIIKESLSPFNFKSAQRDLKVAGATGIQCTLDGNPIYRKTVYSTASNAEDVFVQHDNVEELRAAYNSQEKVSTSDEDFNL